MSPPKILTKITIIQMTNFKMLYLIKKSSIAINSLLAEIKKAKTCHSVVHCHHHNLDIIIQIMTVMKNCHEEDSDLPAIILTACSEIMIMIMSMLMVIMMRLI